MTEKAEERGRVQITVITAMLIERSLSHTHTHKHVFVLQNM